MSGDDPLFAPFPALTIADAPDRLGAVDVERIDAVCSVRDRSLAALAKAARGDPARFFEGRDFRGVSLAGIDARGVSLRNADLRGCAKP